MEQARATRSELLATRNRITLARRGRDLLTEKRNALLEELRRTAEHVLRGSDELEASVGRAVAALAQAEALDGPEAVHSATLAARGRITLEVSGMNVMGVAVPVIQQKSVARSPLQRGYSLLGASSRIDAAAEAFEAQLDLLIQLATSEMRLRRLANEIGRTTRLVNALDHVIISRLEAQHDWIGMALEEQERENRFRLKRVKSRIANKRMRPHAQKPT